MIQKKNISNYDLLTLIKMLTVSGSKVNISIQIIQILQINAFDLKFYYFGDEI